MDDSDEDVSAEGGSASGGKAPKDGLRFVWPRALAVSDAALYVADTGSSSILKAAIQYAAEETVPVP